MAWINTSAKGQEKNRSETYLLSYPELPRKIGYITEYLFDIGIVSKSGGAISTIQWSEISAWCQMTGVFLERFEVDLIRELSKEYVNQFYLSNNENTPSPWRPEEIPPNDSLSNDNVKNLFRGIAKRWKSDGLRKPTHKS